MPRTSSAASRANVVSDRARISRPAPRLKAARSRETSSLGRRCDGSTSAPLMRRHPQSNREHGRGRFARWPRCLRRSLRGRRVSLLGLTYKPGTNTCDAPCGGAVSRLATEGATVTAFDPAMKNLPELGGLLRLRGAPTRLHAPTPSSYHPMANSAGLAGRCATGGRRAALCHRSGPDPCRGLGADPSRALCRSWDATAMSQPPRRTSCHHHRGQRRPGPRDRARLCKRGAYVVICASRRRATRRGRVQRSPQLRSSQTVVAFRRCLRPRAVDPLVAVRVERFGRLHVLVNNAGVYGPIGPYRSSSTGQAWVRAIEINLYGSVLMSAPFCRISNSIATARSSSSPAAGRPVPCRGSAPTPRRKPRCEVRRVAGVRSRGIWHRRECHGSGRPQHSHDAVSCFRLVPKRWEQSSTSA